MIVALLAIALAPMARAATLTLYTSLPGSIPTQLLGPGGVYTGLPAFDPIQQTAPAAPTPAQPTAISLSLPTGAVPGLSKPQRPDFVGISIELSVATNIIGTNGTFLNPIFLNHVQNIRSRSGAMSIRLGGNSQDKAAVVPAISPPLSGATVNKTTDPIAHAHNSSTPLLTFSEDLFYAMNNISSLVGVGWYFGLPFLNATNIPAIATAATTILGNNLLGLQLGNEPDEYLTDGNTVVPWNISNYIGLFGSVRQQYVPTLTNLIAPSVCCSGFFKIDDIINAGFLTAYAQYLSFVSVQHYKDNAKAVFPEPVLTPQEAFDTYLTHASAQEFFVEYVNASIAIAAAGKEFIMTETNTASGGGFAGASDSYAAALYLIDLALQAASVGFSQILLHNGGSGQYYNLFTPPPGNMSSFEQWTTSSPYYSALAMAEVMSESGSQVKDLLLNNNSTSTPGYAIYKNGQPIRLALFNYITDSSGANDVTVSVSVGGGTTGQASSTPASVNVKYFYSATGSSADKFNLTWAGQTMGDQYGSDGRLTGTESTQTITCSAGVCNIPLKAPSFALVLLDGVNAVANPTEATQTFATSVQTKLSGGTVVVPPSVLSTSNGRGGSQEIFNVGGTSFQKPVMSGAMRPVIGVALVGVASAFVVMTGLWR